MSNHLAHTAPNTPQAKTRIAICPPPHPPPPFPSPCPQRHGGAYALSIRNPKELANLEESWAGFVAAFAPHDPALFAEPGVAALGARLKAAAVGVSERVCPTPDDRWATLVHGDLKAMNVMLPSQPRDKDDEVEVGEGGEAMLIDFASAGVGLGVSDVAMLLTHSVAPEDLADGGEERLLDQYLNELDAARGAAAVAASPYPRELARKHYRLAAIDYCRFVAGRFWRGATPAQFEARADSQNTTLVNRSIPAALAFVRRVDKFLAEYESEVAAE